MSAESQFWCAVQVAPRHELKVANVLTTKGYDQFTPTYRVKNKWSDRVKNVDLPLFPGYVFCRVGRETTGVVFRTPGVTRIVSFGGKICPIEDQEIESLQKAFGSGRALCPSSNWQPGEKVQIKEGPLAGVVGTLQYVTNQLRLVISIDMLMKAVSVNIDASEVIPVAQQSLSSAH